MDKIDETGKKIIDYLQIKGFQTGTIMAGELELPPRLVYRRLKQLRENKTIMVMIRVNSLVLGYRFWVRVGINTAPRFSQQVIHELVEHPSVNTVNEITGKFNLLIGARFKTAEHLMNFINEELPSLQGIENAETFLLVKPRKYLNFLWEYGEPAGPGPDSLDASVKGLAFALDKIDRSILDIITQEGPTSAQKLSKRIGTSAPAIQRHMKAMTDNQVYTSAVRINPDLANQEEFIATLGITVKDRPAQSVLDEIMLDQSHINNASLCIGRFNIMLNCSFYRYDMIYEYINVRLYGIPGINSIESYIYTKRHKYNISQY